MPVDAEEMDPLYVPASTSQRVMPNVLNKTRSDARSAIEEAGLSAVFKVGPSTTRVKRGRVYYQYPTPGSKVVIGQTATVWVSSGVLSGGQAFPYPRP